MSKIKVNSLSKNYPLLHQMKTRNNPTIHVNAVRSRACRSVRRIAIKKVEITCLTAGQNGDRQARKEARRGKKRQRGRFTSGRAGPPRDETASPFLAPSARTNAGRKRNSEIIDWPGIIVYSFTAWRAPRKLREVREAELEYLLSLYFEVRGRTFVTRDVLSRRRKFG